MKKVEKSLGKPKKKTERVRGARFGVHTIQLFHLFKSGENISNAEVVVLMQKHKRNATKAWIGTTLCNLKNVGLLKKVKIGSNKIRSGVYVRAKKLPKKYSEIFK